MSVAIGRPISASDLHTLTAAPAASRPSKLERRNTVINALNARGWPRGLISCVADSVEVFPLRFVIVDNSGSMQAPDGQRLINTNGVVKSIASSRWNELGDICTEMADIATSLRAPTRFHLLNPSPAGQYFAVGDDGDTILGPVVNASDSLQSFKAALNSSPTGTTPLTEAVQKLIDQIAPHREKLLAHGQQVVVVLATDGLPNDRRSFFQALQELQRLPVWLVVRLCTDEQHVVDYWGELDKQLEAPIETVDDLKSEAKEIAAHNPWLCYAPSLQIARTMGLSDKLFDLIDEQKLLPSQAKQLIERVLGCDALPEPELEFDQFAKQVERAQTNMNRVYNPLSGRMEKWVDVHKLGRCLDKSSNACAIM